MSLVRVRLAEEKAWVTYKGPPRPDSIFKTREELEIEVENGAIALQILENIGMHVWFRYQKYRQEYALSVPGRPEEKVHLALDETPIGNYAEFEGSEDGVRATASALGFAESKFLRASYYSLYAQYCSERGESPGHMLFPVEQAVKNLPI
jgi:adenylate cyclase class 2